MKLEMRLSQQKQSTTLLKRRAKTLTQFLEIFTAVESKQKFLKHEKIVEVMLEDERANPEMLIEDLKSGGARPGPRIQRLAVASGQPETEVGLFVLAATYAIQANTVIAGQIGSVLQPIFAHVREDAGRQIGGFLRATRLLSAIAVPLSLVQAAIAVPVFHLLFPPKWTGSIAIFAVLSVAQAFVFVSAPAIALPISGRSA